MKKILLLSALFIFACSSAQNITVLNKMVESNQSLVGLNNEFFTINRVYNDKGTTLCYDIKILKVDMVDFIKNNMSKNDFINDIKKAETPNHPQSLLNYNIILKYNYFFNNQIVKSFSILPYEWGIASDENLDMKAHKNLEKVIENNEKVIENNEKKLIPQAPQPQFIEPTLDKLPNTKTYSSLNPQFQLKQFKRKYDFGQKKDLPKEQKLGYYPNGKLKYESNTIDGIRQGLTVVYYESGQIKGTMNYVDGKMQGEYVEFYKSGGIQTKVNLVNEKPQGEKISYYESGNIQSKVNFVDGISQGESISYYESGKINMKMTFLDGKTEGEVLGYYESGEIEFRINYSGGVKKGEEIIYYKNGGIKEYTVN